MLATKPVYWRCSCMEMVRRKVWTASNDALWNQCYQIGRKISKLFNSEKLGHAYNASVNKGITCLVHHHDDVIIWKHFPRNWPFVREIHRSPVNFPHKGQWRGALMFSLIYAWINDWVNNREAGDLRRQHGHYDVIVMPCLHRTQHLMVQNHQQAQYWLQNHTYFPSELP